MTLDDFRTLTADLPGTTTLAVDTAVVGLAREVEAVDLIGTVAVLDLEEIVG